MRKPARRLPCGCKAYKTKAPRCIDRQARKGVKIKTMSCACCSRTWRRVEH